MVHSYEFYLLLHAYSFLRKASFLEVWKSLQVYKFLSESIGISRYHRYYG